MKRWKHPRLPWIALGFGVVVGAATDLFWLMSWWSPNSFNLKKYPLEFAGPVATVGFIVPVLTSLVFFWFVGSEKLKESLLTGALYGAGAGALSGLSAGLAGDALYWHVREGEAIGDAILGSLLSFGFYTYAFAAVPGAILGVLAGYLLHRSLYRPK